MKQGHVLMKDLVFSLLPLTCTKCVSTCNTQHFVKRGMTCVKADRRAESGADLLQMTLAALHLLFSRTSNTQAASLSQRRLGDGISTEKHARI